MLDPCVRFICHQITLDIPSKKIIAFWKTITIPTDLKLNPLFWKTIIIPTDLKLNPLKLNLKAL